MGDSAVQIVYDMCLSNDCNCKYKFVVVTCMRLSLEIRHVLPFATFHCLPPPSPLENPKGATRQGKLGEEVPMMDLRYS